MNNTPLLVLLLCLTAFVPVAASAQQTPTPIPDAWMGGGSNPQQLQVLTVGDYAWWSQYVYGSGVIVTRRMVLLSAHQLYEFDRGWVRDLYVIRANHGSIQTALTYRPERWHHRVRATRGRLVAGYTATPGNSLESLNKEFGAVQVRRSAPALYNHVMRLEGERPTGARFQTRPNANRHVAQLASTATQKSVMCYPGGFYTLLSHPDRWKLHETYPQGNYIFFRRGPARDATGWPNGYFASSQIRLAGGCSGGSLQYMNGSAARTLLGTVVAADVPIHGVPHATVRLAGARVVRFLRQLHNSGY